MPAHDTTITYGARWVFPVAGPPVPDGRVTVRGDRLERVLGPGGPCDLDLGNVAILPGFVNAHTHLDLCGAHGRCPPKADFTAWLRQVIAFRQQRSLEQVRQDVAAGIAACVISGTTLVGDISSGGVSWDLLAESPLRATVYYELIGLTKARAEHVWQEAERWLVAHPATATCRPGLSPHAPYSVRRELFDKVMGRVSNAQPPIPVAIHLAETRDETVLLERRSGSFVDFLRELGVWDPAGLVADADEVQQLFRDIACVALVHCNYLPTLGPVLDRQIICPRTSYAFGRRVGPPRHPVDLCVLGTDSLASNPDLDILAEARFLYRHCDIGANTDRWDRDWLVRSITADGADALGWEKETGSLTPGKSADLVVLPLPNRAAADPHDLIFDSDLPVQAVLFRGAWVVGAPA